LSAITKPSPFCKTLDFDAAGNKVLDLTDGMLQWGKEGAK